MKKIKKGFSLVELMLVLSIAISLSVTAFFIYEKVRQEFLVQNTISNMEMISQNILQIFQGHGNEIPKDQYNDYGKNSKLISIMKTFIKKDSGLKLSTSGIYMYKDKNDVYYNAYMSSYDSAKSNAWKGLTIELYFKDITDCVATANKVMMNPSGGYLTDFNANMYVEGNIEKYSNNFMNYNVIKSNPRLSYSLCSQNTLSPGFAVTYIVV